MINSISKTKYQKYIRIIWNSNVVKMHRELLIIY